MPKLSSTKIIVIICLLRLRGIEVELTAEKVEKFWTILKSPSRIFFIIVSSKIPWVENFCSYSYWITKVLFVWRIWLLVMLQAFVCLTLGSVDSSNTMELSSCPLLVTNSKYHWFCELGWNSATTQRRRGAVLRRLGLLRVDGVLVLLWVDGVLLLQVDGVLFSG